MRTAEELEAMRQHPASGTATIDPYDRFFGALDELQMMIELHGAGSVEAAEARDGVRIARAQVAVEWRRTRAA